jgi:hypothetical protein
VTKLFPSELLEKVKVVERKREDNRDNRERVTHSKMESEVQKGILFVCEPIR